MKWDSKVYIVGLVIYLLSAVFFLLGDTGSLGPFLLEYIVLVPLLALVYSVFKPYSVYNIIIILLGIGVIGDVHRHGPAFLGVFFVIAIAMFGVVQIKNWLKGKVFVYKAPLVIGIFFILQVIMLFVMSSIDKDNAFARGMIFESIRYVDVFLAVLSVYVLIKDSNKNLLNIGVKRFLLIYSLEIIISQVFQIVKLYT